MLQSFASLALRLLPLVWLMALAAALIGKQPPCSSAARASRIGATATTDPHTVSQRRPWHFGGSCQSAADRLRFVLRPLRTGLDG